MYGNIDKTWENQGYARIRKDMQRKVKVCFVCHGNIFR